MRAVGSALEVGRGQEAPGPLGAVSLAGGVPV